MSRINGVIGSKFTSFSAKRSGQVSRNYISKRFTFLKMNFPGVPASFLLR